VSVIRTLYVQGTTLRRRQIYKPRTNDDGGAVKWYLRVELSPIFAPVSIAVRRASERYERRYHVLPA